MYALRRKFKIVPILNFSKKSKCTNGHLEVAKWLIEISQNKNLKLGLINIHSNNEFAFIGSCMNGHLEVAQWLIEISQVENECEKIGSINIYAVNGSAFVCGCMNGHLKVAKWLLEILQKDNATLGSMNIHSLCKEAFIKSCENSHLEVAKWLYLLGGMKFDIDVINDNYDNIKNNKLLVRIIGSDYKNNNKIKKEYLKEYHKWKIGIIIRVCGKLMKFYNYVLEKTYSPKGIGYFRAHDDFNDKIKDDAIKC